MTSAAPPSEEYSIGWLVSETLDPELGRSVMTPFLRRTSRSTLLCAIQVLISDFVYY